MKKLIILFITILSLSMTSCIELVEEIWINPDKTGRIELRIDAGRLSMFFSAISEYIDADLNSQIVNAPKKMAASIENIKGISEVKYHSDLKAGKLALNFNFDNQKSLNNAWFGLVGLDKKFYYPKPFKISKNRLVKKDFSKFIGQYLNQNKDKLKNVELLKSISYVSIFHLPQKVRKIKNKEQTKLSDQNTVIQSNTLENIFYQRVDLGQKILF